MSVCHSAFIAYGAQVTLKDDATVDDLGEWLGRPGKDLGLGFSDGDRGIVVGDRRFIASCDFDDAEMGSLTLTSPPTDVKDRIERAAERGAPFTIVSGVRWWVGGSTW